MALAQSIGRWYGSATASHTTFLTLNPKDNEYEQLVVLKQEEASCYVKVYKKIYRNILECELIRYIKEIA